MRQISPLSPSSPAQAGYLHDVGLMHRRNPLPSLALRIVEGISCDTLTRIPSDELNTLYDTIDDFVFDSRVLSFGVLADEDGVHVVVWSFEAFDGQARADVCEEVEGTPQCQVEGYVTFANCAGDDDEDLFVRWEREGDLLGVARGPKGSVFRI